MGEHHTEAMTPTAGRMAAAIRLREDPYVYADCNRILFPELRQLGDGPADRDPDGATSNWSRYSEQQHGHTTNWGDDRATDSNHYAGGGPESNANAEHTRAAAWHNPNYASPGNTRKHSAKHRYNAESNGDAGDAVRSTHAGRVRDSFQSGNDESDHARIHHTKLNSELQRAGFQRTRFIQPIAAQFGEYTFG